MNIAFHTMELRRLSESRTLAKRKLGADVAAAFHALLADIEVAQTPEELPLGFASSNDLPLAFTVLFTNGYRAIFESNHSKDRNAARTGSINWSRVNRVKLMEIVKSDD